jgi:hypothetical protein
MNNDDVWMKNYRRNVTTLRWLGIMAIGLDGAIKYADTCGEQLNWR